VFKFLCVKSILISVLLGLTLCNTVYAVGYKMPDGEVLNDPTRPYDWNKVSQPKALQKQFVLNYILKTPQRTNAIINGKKVTAGEIVSGAKVIKINQSTVLILVDGKRRTLHLHQGGSIRK
jgi:hypothetical protein